MPYYTPAQVGMPLADVRRAPIVNIDFGVGDPVTPEPLSLATPTHLAGEPLSWRVYPVETIVAEKLHALYTLGAAHARLGDSKAAVATLGQARELDLRRQRRSRIQPRPSRIDKVPSSVRM